MKVPVRNEDVIFDAPPKWQGFLGGAVALSVFFAFVSFDREGQGRIAAMSAAAIIASTRICWPLRRYGWFWIAMGAIAAVHIIAVVAVPWSHPRYPGYVLIPVMVLDSAAILGVMALLAKVLQGRSQKTG
jgi:hypothetical protein